MSATIIAGEEPEDDVVAPVKQDVPTTKSEPTVIQGEEPEEPTSLRSDLESSSSSSSGSQLSSSSSGSAAPRLKLTGLERKIVEKNENIRKTMAVKVLGVYQQLGKDLAQISGDLNNTLALTQDVSHRLCEANDDLVALQAKLPSTVSFVNAFITGTPIPDETTTAAAAATTTAPIAQQ